MQIYVKYRATGEKTASDQICVEKGCTENINDTISIDYSK